MDPRSSHPPLERFFAGLSEYVFQTRMGVVDPPLVDYIGQLLARFCHRDAIYRVRNPSGRRLEEVAEMLAEAEARIGAARREVHRHIGDFTLFWTGVYPEALRQIRRHSRLDSFVDYCEQGKRAYYIASTIATDDDTAIDNGLLERLSHDFELCAYGLREVRREWERQEPPEGQDVPGPWIIN